jgi:hypothetical protein
MIMAILGYVMLAIVVAGVVWAVIWLIGATEEAEHDGAVRRDYWDDER